MVRRILTEEQLAEIPENILDYIDEGMTPKAKEILKKLDDGVVIIEHHVDLKDEMKFRSFILSLFDTAKEGFEHEEFRHHPVYYKFRDDPEEEMKWLPFNVFIINCIFWYPCTCLDFRALDEDFIVSPFMMPELSPSLIKKYFDERYVTKYIKKIPQMPDVPIDKVSMRLSRVLGIATWLFTRTSADFSMFFGISTSIEIYMGLAKKYPRINEIYHTKLDPTAQPAELEKQVTSLRDEFVQIVKDDPEFNSLKPLVIKSGIKLDQLTSVVAAINLKPDIDGTSIPYPIESNYLVDGLKNLIDYYIVAISGRKAAIFNKEYMGRSGYLMILIDMMCANVKLSKTTMDCGSPNPIGINVKTYNHLSRLEGRRYRLPGQKEYKIIHPKEDKNLIGETIYVRSPETCACKDGICRECYGDLYYINVHNEAPGIFSATHVMNPVVQSILSAKHFQTTVTDPIDFDDEFYKFFSIEATDIIIDLDDTVVPKDYYLVIRKDDINSEDGDEIELNYSTKRRRRRRRKASTSPEGDDMGIGEEGEDGSVELPYYTSKFEIIKNLNEEDEERIEFSEKGEKDLYISLAMLELMTAYKDDTNGDYLCIPLEDIDKDKFIFRVDALSNELTKPMKKIQNLLNNSKHEGCTTYQEITNRMLDLMIDSKLDAQSVHAEVIIRQIIRRADNRIKRPDFSKIVLRKDYQLMAVISSLKTCPSVITALCNSYLKEQLIRLPETFRKEATSLLDDLFKQKLTPRKKRA